MLKRLKVITITQLMDKEFIEILNKKRSELTPEMIEEARRLQLKFINEDLMKELILLRKSKIVKIWK